MTIARIGVQAALLVALAASAGGCGAGSRTQAVAGPEPEAAPTARVLTDLSSLSPKPAIQFSAAAAALKPPDVREDAPPSRSPLAFGDVPGSVRHVGTGFNPAVEQLMNAKAAEFANFSYDLMDHVWAAIRVKEQSEEIVKIKLPTELKPVIITATLDKYGMLTELVLEQHSGKSAIDRMFLEACKKSLWSTSPPPSALTPDSVYQARVEFRIENYTTLDGEHWNFKTFMGVGLL